MDATSLARIHPESAVGQDSQAAPGPTAALSADLAPVDAGNEGTQSQTVYSEAYVATLV